MVATNKNNTIIIMHAIAANDDSGDAADGLDTEEEEEPEGLEDAIPQTADEIVSARLLSGALSDACDIEIQARPLGVEEEEMIKIFVDRGCSCDLGPNKTPCCKSFSVEHSLRLR